jgi:hypothetical protein
MTSNSINLLGKILDNSELHPVCDANYFLKSFELNAPPRSDCAYIGKRALSWATWLPGISGAKKSSFLDRNNLEFSHQHIFIGDKSDNIGWGEKGLFSESSEKYRYYFDSTCYNGQAMRRAISSIQNLARYNPFTNNCQKFIESVLNRYKILVDGKYL